MEFNKEEIAVLRSILLPDSGHTKFMKVNKMKNFFAEYLKQPLTITDDKVDIYPGDTFYYVDREDNVIHTIENVREDDWIPSLTFSTESAAKEFLNNSKEYSMNDILKAVNNWSAISHITEHEIIDFLKC